MLRALVCLCLLVCALAPASASADGLIVSEGAFGSFSEPVSLAADDAGRVYVADAGAGRVLVFDRAQDGNKPVTTIGQGKLQRPTGVAVDNRGRVYVADAGRDVIEMYESAVDRFAPRGTLAGPGTGRGELDTPWALAADPTQRLYALERGNLRISIFRPARARAVVFQTAFGIALPEPFTRPWAIGLDFEGRMYVPNADPAHSELRAFDKRGRFITAVGGDRYASPRGVAVDRFDRVIVVDTGHDALEVLGPLKDGAQVLDRYTGDLHSPLAAAFAPGSLVYVLEGGRVVRLRFDDADVDGVADAGDNCLGLANPTQANADDDEHGDACDDDDDDDGRLDSEDRCPTEPAAAKDEDGCRDPLTRFLVPAQNRTLNRRALRLTGRSEGGELGILRVEVAVARRLDSAAILGRAARCAFLDPAHHRTVTRACSDPVWIRATGRSSWRIRLSASLLSPGSYAAFARAAQRSGPVESRRVLGRNVRTFRVA